MNIIQCIAILYKVYFSKILKSFFEISYWHISKNVNVYVWNNFVILTLSKFILLLG